MFQILSTNNGDRILESHQWAVGGLFRSFVIGQHCHFAPVSTLLEDREDLNHPSTAVGGISRLCVCVPSRKDLNNPLTAVGGISRLCVCVPSRKDLNNPLTAVGGISRLCVCVPSRKDLNNPLTAVSGIFAFCAKPFLVMITTYTITANSGEMCGAFSLHGPIYSSANSAGRITATFPSVRSHPRTDNTPSWEATMAMASF